MALPQKQIDKKHTYADYLTWDDGQRWELIDGEAYCMSPAPSSAHQRVSRTLTRIIDTHLIGKRCELFAAPFDVRLSERLGVSDNYVETVVQPDLLVVCDKSKLDERGCNGAPDLIIEITSPSTSKVDLTTKFDLYEKYRVREYWIIHPAEKTLLVFKLQESGRYGTPDRYADTGIVPVSLLGDLMINLAELFVEE